nr:RHS repeat-associated core domain-containing protein [Variovorax sp. Root318D1]
MRAAKRVRNGRKTVFTWDGFNRMTAATDHDGITTTFSYDPLGRRIAKRSGDATTLFGWDGDVLAFESTQSTAALNEQQGQGWSVHYIHERDSFVPLVQIRQPRAMALSETTDVKALMEFNGGVYDIEQDPLWNGEQRSVPRAFDRKEMAFYQCDHLGTPQELTDHEGSIAWSAQYKAWGEAREAISEAGRRAGFRNPIRFQGQYFDEETGLHYNRHRYFDPHAGRFASSDPIKLAGGFNLYEYAPNPVQWLDSLGLQRSKGCPDALEEAKQEAERLRAAGGKLPTATCAMVNRRTGKVYTGTSGTKPTNISGKLGASMPTSSLEGWDTNNCAEIDAGNKALKDGSSIVDLDVATVYTKSGESMPCCRNCSVTFKNFKVFTGKR